jgi:hypothetical protein
MGIVCFGESKFPWGGGDRKFLDLGDGLHDVYLEVMGFRVYDSISIKNKNKSKCKQQMSRQPRGLFRDGLWGGEQVAKLRVIVALPPQNQVSRQVPRCRGQCGKERTQPARASTLLAEEKWVSYVWGLQGRIKGEGREHFTFCMFGFMQPV